MIERRGTGPVGWVLPGPVLPEPGWEEWRPLESDIDQLGAKDPSFEPEADAACSDDGRSHIGTGATNVRQGKMPGRPSKPIDVERARRLLADGGRRSGRCPGGPIGIPNRPRAPV